MSPLRPARYFLIATLCGGAVGASAEGPAGSGMSSTGDAVLQPNRVVAGSAVAGPTAPAIRREFDLADTILGEAARNWGYGHFSIPLTREDYGLEASHPAYVNALAIQWQHQPDSGNRLTVNAQRADSARLANDAVQSSVSGASASLAWRRQFQSEAQVTGRFYLGDEDSRDSALGRSARRYYGLEFEGRYPLWRDHAPFAGFRWQRSDVDAVDGYGIGTSLRNESGSRFAAGWDWRISPNWDLRAQANYRFLDDGSDPAETDRTHFYFSSRYGFR
jgi:hypothetical protein